MSVTINGTTGVSGVDGSATTPAFQGSDTDTGLFYGTDIVGISTGGSERVRVNASGNVGIGTTSPQRTLDISSTAQVISVFRSSNVNGSRLRIIDVNNVETDGIDLNTTTTGSSIISGSAVTLKFLNFWTGGAERMRITSDGEVYIAGTTDQGAYNLQCNGTGVWGAGAYVNGSDERIKDNITPLDSGLDVIAKLNPVTYTYKEDWSKDQSVQTGFIAQELLVALEGKNYVDGVVQQGGSEGYYSVAYQNIIPILTKAIQEQQELIKQLQLDVSALKEANNV